MNAETISMLFLAIMLLAVVLGSISLAFAASGNKAGSLAARSPHEILVERYARGELSRQQYLEALVDILKDRYVRNEITIDEYEARLDLIMADPKTSPRAGARRGNQLSSHGSAGG